MNNIEKTIAELQTKLDKAYNQIIQEQSKEQPNQYIIQYCEGKVYAFTCAITELGKLQYVQ